MFNLAKHSQSLGPIAPTPGEVLSEGGVLPTGDQSPSGLILPVNNAGEFSDKIMRLVLAGDDEKLEEAKGEIMEVVSTDVQEEVVSAFDSLREQMSNPDQRAILDVTKMLWGALPPSLQGQTMPENEPKVSNTFNLSDHILKESAATDSQGCQGCSGGMTKEARMHSNDAYLLYGVNEKRICPKLAGKNVGNVVSEYTCRYHCIDGLVLDDNKVICGEAIYRAHVMDKFSRDYVDENGQPTGGYIEKRFEVNHNVPPENRMRLAPGELRKPTPASWGSTEARMQAMRKAEGEDRGYKPATNTGDPFQWGAEADDKQNNVDESQQERDRREEASGHQTVNYEGERQENEPKKAFNLREHRTVTAAKGKVDSFVEGTQRGYAYGLVDETGQRIVERYVHPASSSPEDIEKAYQQASLGASLLLQTWKRRRDLVEDQSASLPGKLYSSESGQGLLKEASQGESENDWTCPKCNKIINAKDGSKAWGLIHKHRRECGGKKEAFNLKQFKSAQMTGPRGPIGPDNPQSDDLGLSSDFGLPEDMDFEPDGPSQILDEYYSNIAHCNSVEDVDRNVAEALTDPELNSHDKDEVVDYANSRKSELAGQTAGSNGTPEALAATDNDVKEAKSPPGFKTTVEKMKDEHGFSDDKAFGLAWNMYNEGAESHYDDDTGEKKEEYKEEEKGKKAFNLRSFKAAQYKGDTPGTEDTKVDTCKHCHSTAAMSRHGKDDSWRCTECGATEKATKQQHIDWPKTSQVSQELHPVRNVRPKPKVRPQPGRIITKTNVQPLQNNQQEVDESANDLAIDG